MLWVDFLRGESFWSLFYAVLLQPESQASLGQVQIPRQAEAWQPPEDQIPGRSKQVSLSRIGSLGRSRHVDLQEPLDWWVPERLKHDNLLRTKSLGKSRQVDLLGPPDWSWASPISPVWPGLRRIQFSLVQSLSHVWLFATPWTAACQASLSITNSRSPPKPMSIESLIPSNPSSVVPFFSCPQSFPASGSFQMS